MLGDYFPDELKKQFVDNNVEIGNALLVEVENFNIDHKKYVIIIALTNQDVGFVVINSIINKNIDFTSERHKNNIPIYQSDYSFLCYDSYVNCNSIHKFSIEYVKECISKDPKCVKGSISNDMLRKIHYNLSISSTISIKEKKEFGFI